MLIDSHTPLTKFISPRLTSYGSIHEVESIIMASSSSSPSSSSFSFSSKKSKTINSTSSQSFLQELYGQLDKATLLGRQLSDHRQMKIINSSNQTTAFQPQSRYRVGSERTVIPLEGSGGDEDNESVLSENDIEGTNSKKSKSRPEVVVSHIHLRRTN